MFLFSKRRRASKNSFRFSPAKFRLYIMSLTDISDLPKFSCRLWRCLTMDLSSLPQRQVVFRIRTTIVLTRVCSVVCRLDKSPIAPTEQYCNIIFKDLCLNKRAKFELNANLLATSTFLSNKDHDLFRSNSSKSLLSCIQASCKDPSQQRWRCEPPNGFLWLLSA